MDRTMIVYQDEKIIISNNKEGKGFDLQFSPDDFQTLFHACIYASKHFDMTSWQKPEGQQGRR